MVLMIMTMFATSIKFVKLVNMIILRFLRFLGFLAKYIVKWLKCQKFNNSIIRAIELLRSRQIKRSRIQEVTGPLDVCLFSLYNVQLSFLDLTSF